MEFLKPLKANPPCGMADAIAELLDEPWSTYLSYLRKTTNSKTPNILKSQHVQVPRTSDPRFARACGLRAAIAQLLDEALLSLVLSSE
jgi:hypothetical protein